MSAPVAVLVQGDTAPEAFEDFCAMFEATLAKWRARDPLLLMDVQSLRLQEFLTRFAQEEGLRVRAFRPHRECASAGVQHVAIFLNATTARSFTLPSYEGLLSKPLVLVVSPHRS